MDTKRLAEIRQRCEAATPPLWEHSVRSLSIRGMELMLRYDMGPTPTDAEFIAHARQDMPDLLDEIDRLRKLVIHVRAEQWEVVRLAAGLQGAESLDAEGTEQAARRWVEETGEMLSDWQPAAAEAEKGTK